MAQRRSRKRRGKQRQRQRRPPAQSEPAREPRGTTAAYARSRQKDEAARAALKPLAPGERPTAVTVGAVVALLLALANLVSYAAGFEVSGRRPSVVGVAAYSGLMLFVAWGMWRAKYYAVLGMEALLGIVILVFSLLLLRAANAQSAIIAVAVVAAAGTLFWFLIKAMARIQMPERPGSS
ncbi:MAG: hypothetical protein ABR581_09045 [Thermoleophilaceae bacterium]